MYSSWNTDRNPLVIPAGALRDYVQIQVASDTPDSFGQPQSVWYQLASGFAGIKELSQREAFQANQFSPQVTHRITLRWLSVAVQAGMRVQCGSRLFKIQAVVNVENRNRVLQLLCLETTEPVGVLAGPVVNPGGGSGNGSSSLVGQLTIAGLSIADGTVKAVTPSCSVTGAALGDAVSVAATPALPAGVQALGKVSGANAVSLEVWNLSGQSVVLSATLFTVFVSQS